MTSLGFCRNRPESSADKMRVKRSDPQKDWNFTFSRYEIWLSLRRLLVQNRPHVGNGPNTVSESTVSDTELSGFFGPHRDPGREVSEFLSAYYLCAKANSPSFSQNSPSLPQNSVRLSEFSSQRRREDNKNKMFAFEGGGSWLQRGKSSKNAFFFCGKRHDNKILKVQILL